ncbi:MAG: hypothetical protein R3C69_04335 [Geminicoccaceae bacterium]
MTGAAPADLGLPTSWPRSVDSSLCRAIRNLAIGPPIRLARIRPKVAEATPISMAWVMPYSSAIRGAQAIAVPCPPISDGAAEHPHRRRQVEHARHRDASDVLHHHVGDGRGQEDDQRPAAGDQVREPGVDADRREEIDEQQVARTEIEPDADPRRRMDQAKAGRTSRDRRPPRGC